MWNSIANLKENLNKIVLDVHEDDDEDYDSYNSRHSDYSDRRFSHNFAHSMSGSQSPPIANGFDSPHISEIEQYKAEMEKLRSSETEVKALLVNYAALLKEKEERISRLHEENISLEQSLNSSIHSQNMLKASIEQSSNRQHRGSFKSSSTGKSTPNGIVSKQDGLSNGTTQHTNKQGNEKELADLLEEKNRSLAAIQATHELQVKQLRMELEKERETAASARHKLQEEQKMSGLFQEELNVLKLDKNKASIEMNKMHDELNERIAEIRRLQTELKQREEAEVHVGVEDLKGVIASLEKENNNLKMEKEELKIALKVAGNSSGQKIPSDASQTLNKDSTSSSENGLSWGSSPEKQAMELTLAQLEKELNEARQGRQKTVHELNRLKQHLLEKESEESEKMDEDSKIIEELRENNEYLRAQLSHLEKNLKQAMMSQEEVKMINNSELQKCKDIINDLNKRVASCMSTIDAKNMELLNLQTALGQYYAEIEAKEYLEGDLAQAREEFAKVSKLLEVANQHAEVLKSEKEEILAKLSQTERTLAEWKNRVNKLDEDNTKLRRALEQSMARLNRMSMDSDFFVDRRIVIKLLVTYFQRNHSKEVLDLMVRMLGFSDEDKQRIGGAQQGAGKGVVRGVFGLPGRLVGGFLGGSSKENPSSSDNQSFADLWVDFLLKETEERERRESAEASSRSNGDQQYGRNPNPTSTTVSTLPDIKPKAVDSPSGLSRYKQQHSTTQSPSPSSSRGNHLLQSDHSDSEFSTVPLNTSENSNRMSSSSILPPPRYQ